MLNGFILFAFGMTMMVLWNDYGMIMMVLCCLRVALKKKKIKSNIYQNETQFLAS